MRFGVLGPVAVWGADGEPVAVPGIKVRALLADLLAHEGRPVPADRLIDDLWGDELPGNPFAALSAKVSQLRRVLEDAAPGGRELLPLHPAGYLLKVETDADAFRSLLAEAERAGDPRTRATLLSDALALWRGPAFADIADEPFAQAAAAHLTERRLTAQEDLAEVRLALGEHARLVGELGRLVTEHPLRERLRAAHMRALYRSGRQSEALDSYETLRALLADELGLEPGADLVALQRAILARDPALAPDAAPYSATARPATNLPAPLADLIGRDDALAEVRARLAADRLVTLTGPGGVGKTRLALEVARGLVESGTGTSPGHDLFPDGVWWVELAALDRPADPDAPPRLVETIIGVLGVRDGTPSAEPVTTVERLADALRARRLLLVLDNCEHVVIPVSELVERLLRAAPGLRILATGQEPLRLAGEVVWSVPPLEVPAHAADVPALEQTASVRLFVTRASASARGFALDADNAPAVATLCRRLDGVPLALELAATRVRALGVHGLVERLDDRFRLLATGHRGAPPRQRTLAAVIGWSWDLLTEAERIVLRRLAVHADGCTLEAAEAVCAEDGLDVLDLLARLVDRSLVMMTDGPDGPRYRLLESVAAYCVERLREARELDRIRLRHRRFHVAFAERATPHLRGPDQRRRLRCLDAEAANLRAALNAAVRDRSATDALRLVNAMAWYWFLRGRPAEARRSLAAALDVDVTEPAESEEGQAVRALRAEALAWAACLGLLQGDVADREDRRREALRQYEEADDPGGLARAQWFLAYTAIDLGDLAVAGELLDLALPAFRSAGDLWGTAAALATRAKLAHVRGDLDALRRDGERSLALFDEIGDRWGRLEATGWLGALAEMTGDLDEAARLHRDGLRLAEELELWPEVGGRHAWLGWIALRRGDFAEAGEHCARALRLAVEQRHQAGEIFAKMGLAFAARQEGRLDLAETHLRDVLERAPRRNSGEAAPPYLPLVLIELGFVAELRGDAPVAYDLHLEAFHLAAGFDTSRNMTIVLDGLAGALSLAGHHERAAWLLGAAAASRASGALSPAPAPAERADIDRVTTRVRTALGEERFAAEAALGAALSPAELRSLLAVPYA
ncbi:BTAD domain-containing putative transcriptional regulator [Microtetraspora malaysiensis]|uniref:BTAD domain-containing putative transcriptional regulator n=1 Tax=Microtetraspora malaysiensis TaxID=161358 RepID=UPI003D8C7776